MAETYDVTVDNHSFSTQFYDYEKEGILLGQYGSIAIKAIGYGTPYKP